MNQHVNAPVEHIDPETGEITEVSAPAPQPTEPSVSIERRTLPLQPVLQEQEPSLPTPAADRIDPKWDIAQVATRGHVHIERFFIMSEKLFWPSIMLASLSLLLLCSSLTVSIPGIPGGGAWIFWMVLGILIVGFILSSGGQFELEATVFGGLGVGVGLWIAAVYAEAYPNGVIAWIGTILKVGLIGGLLWWVGGHALKSFRSSASRAVVMVGGGYVIAVVGLSVLASGMAGNSNFLIMAAQSALTFDEDTYWNLGGGLRGGADVVWMADHAPQPGGLTTAEHAALIKAVQSDLTKFGADANQWEAVAALPKEPIVTRAEKAIRDYAAKLPTGIVVVPQERPVMKLIAHVEGQWSLTLINDRSCAVFLGPWSEGTGCSNETNPQDPLNGYARSELAELKPIPAAETKE